MEKAKTNINDAEKIFGEDFLGPKAIDKTFGYIPEKIPAIPFSQEELKQAKKLGQFLILRIGKAKNGDNLTISRMCKDFKNLVSTTTWPERWDFFHKVSVSPSWALCTKEVISGTTNKNYAEQMQVVSDYIEKKVFKGEKTPEIYKKAIKEFSQKKSSLAKLLDNWNAARKEYERCEKKSWTSDKPTTQKMIKQMKETLQKEKQYVKAVNKILALKIFTLTKRTAAEEFYDMIMYFENNKEWLYKDKSDWTVSLAPNAISLISGWERVCISYFKEKGIAMGGFEPFTKYNLLGASFSRKI